MQKILGEFHPIIVHFPIVLFILVLVFDLVYYFNKPRGLTVANWMLWSGTLFCLPTMATGWMASYSFPANDPIVYQHMTLAFSLFTYSFFHSIFRIVTVYKNWMFAPIVFISLSVINVLLTSATSDRGGLLSHGTTPFKIMAEKKSK